MMQTEKKEAATVEVSQVHSCGAIPHITTTGPRRMSLAFPDLVSKSHVSAQFCIRNVIWLVGSSKQVSIPAKNR